MAGMLRCAAALALLCAASAALAGGYGRGRGRGRGGYGGGYGGGNYGGGYGGGGYGGGYGGGGGGYGGGGYGGGGGGGGGYPYPPHIPGTNPPGPTTKNPGPPGEPTTPDPNGTTNTGAPGTGNTDLTTATTTASETATTTPFDSANDPGLQYCKPEPRRAPILVQTGIPRDPPPSTPQGLYEPWRSTGVCTTCKDFVGDSDVILVRGTSSLDTKVPAQTFTCSSNEQLRIVDDKNRCFRYTGETTSPATALLIPYCSTVNSETKCDFYVTLDNPTIYDDNFGFKPENVSISEPTLLAKDMKNGLSSHLTNFVKVRTISCTGDCVIISFVNCSPPPSDRERRDLGLAGVE